MCPWKNDEKTEKAPADSGKAGREFDEFDPENIMIVSVNDDSKKIRQILSNETSMKIVDTLKKESLSASALSEKLAIPLPTVKYNLDILVDNGLVRIKTVRYSEKGRQVKIYEAPEKVIVFAPETISRISIVTLLQKYVAVFAVAVFGALGFSALRQHFMPVPPLPEIYYADMGLFTAEDGVPLAAGAVRNASTVSDTLFQTAVSLASSDWFWFLSGAALVLAVFLLIDLFKRNGTARQASPAPEGSPEKAAERPENPPDVEAGHP